MDHLIEDKTFGKEDFTQKPLTAGDYDYCTFINCNFSGSELHNTRFLECEFKDCNLGNVKLRNAIFMDVKFTGCKLIGLVFDESSRFHAGASFENCTLNYTSFYGKSMKEMLFRSSTIHEADFSDCDLTGSLFENCDLKDTKFENTVLEKCDFSKAYNYIIDPQKNRIKKARFSLSGLPGLLYSHDIIID